MYLSFLPSLLEKNVPSLSEKISLNTLVGIGKISCISLWLGLESFFAINVIIKCKRFVIK